MLVSMVLSFIGLMITDAGSESNIEMVDIDDKKERRRAQNVKAAQRSYQAKKKERESLLQKNTELMETQMRLLHEKCRLEERLRKLQHVINSMDHTLVTCSNINLATNRKRRALHEVNIKNTTKSKSQYDGNQVLDLSLSGECLSLNADHSGLNNSNVGGHNHETMNIVIVDTPNSSNDEHILDSSSLGIGATQEVSVEPCVLTRGSSHIIGICSRQDDHVFLSASKKTKRAKGQESRPIRGCGSDALRKQRSDYSIIIKDNY